MGPDGYDVSKRARIVLNAAVTVQKLNWLRTTAETQSLESNDGGVSHFQWEATKALATKSV